jgi:hypothetical protein
MPLVAKAGHVHLVEHVVHAPLRCPIAPACQAASVGDQAMTCLNDIFTCYEVL